MRSLRNCIEGEGVRGWMVVLVLVAWCVPWTRGEAGVVGGRGVGGRLLLGFTETRGNASFQCSPSGPCLPCQYSEKNDEKYHCSETGYRIPFKCTEIQDGSKEKTSKKFERRLLSHQDHNINAAVESKLVTAITHFKWRKLLDDASTSEGGEQNYITYRSCVPVGADEKLSVLGFEVIMVCLLLISGPIVYSRQKRTVAMPAVGAVRIPTNSPRF